MVVHAASARLRAVLEEFSESAASAFKFESAGLGCQCLQACSERFGLYSVSRVPSQHARSRKRPRRWQVWTVWDLVPKLHLVQLRRGNHGRMRKRLASLLKFCPDSDSDLAAPRCVRPKLEHAARGAARLRRVAPSPLRLCLSARDAQMRAIYRESVADFRIFVTG